MDQEIREKLSHILELEEENNHMLRALRRAQRLSTMLSILWWLFIIGSTVGVYYYYQPQIQKLIDFSTTAWETMGSAKSTLQNFNQQLSQ